MANGYIGKISAIVTANTTELSKNLRGAVGDVDRFAQKLNRSVAAAAASATRSLDGIFTPLQRLQRQLQTGLQGGILRERDVSRIQLLAQSVREIVNPAKQAATQFDRLSTAVAAEFTPALLKAQTQVEKLQATINRTGRANEETYERTRRSVERTTQAVARLTEAQRQAAALATGQELRFTNPALAAENARALDLQRRAAALTPSQIQSAGIAGLVAQQRQASEEAARLQANLENARLTGGRTTARERAVEAQVEAYRRLNEQIEQQIAGINRAANASRVAAANEIALLQRREQGGRDAEAARLARQDFTVRQAAAQSSGLGLFGSQAGTAEQRALASARELSAQFARLPESAQQGLAGLAGIAANLANRVDQGRASAEQLEAVLARLRTRIEAASPAAAIARANAQLALVPDQPPPPPPRTDLGDRLQITGADRITGLTGSPNLDSNDRFGLQAQRDIDALATRVGNVRQQLETLPNSVRTRFIPELQRAIVQLVRLQNAPNATAEAIENAALRVERLEASARRAQAALNFRQSFGGAGLRGIEEGLNQQALQGYNAQLQLLQQTLAGTSQAARGPAVAAFNNLRNAIADAMERGTLETQQTRQEIARLTQEAVRAAGAAANINPRRLAARLARVGDVARGAFGNASLAIQQAAFAVDDFFSVTGGLDQRIRAAANNISQLGFITGSTTGLILGISASISAQLVVALLRWANAGTEAQDRTKALNEALARQKSLVEELASAFDSLGNRLLQGVFSPAAEEAREVAREIDQIRKKQKEFRDATVIDLDPEVQRQRAIRGARERQLEGEENVGRRIAIQNQIAAARRAEEEAARAATGRPAPTANAVEAALRRTVFVSGTQGLSPANRRDLARIRQDVAGAGNDPQQLIQLLRNARAGQEQLALENAFNQVRAQLARQNVEVITRLIAELERLQIAEKIDAAGLKIVESLGRPAADLRDAQERLKQAVEAGVPGASLLLRSVDEIGDGLDDARQTIVNRLEQGLPLDQATIDAATRQRDAALQNAEATREAVAATDIARQALDRFAEALDRARQEAQSNLQQAQQRADEARRQDLGFSTPATRQAREQADADLARQRELAGNVEQEAAAARERFAQRVRETQEVRRRGELAAEADRRGGDATNRARAAGFNGRTYMDDAAAARQAGNNELADFLEETRAFLSQAAEELAIPIRDFWAGVQEAIDAYESIINDAATETERALARIAEIDSQLGTVGVLAPGRREELVRERAALEQQAVELDADVRRARDESTREAERAAAAERGRGLSLTDGERAAADLTRGLEDIRQFFGRQAEEGTGLVDFEAQREAQRRLIDDSFRSAAPAVFALADSVQNAVLQGPSRAALNATDISTVEGARELNRLIRGDDAARDQNLVELRTQSDLLRQLVQKAEEAGVVPVAN